MHHATDAAPAETIRYSEVIAALSYALDITEGQPAGHAARTCILGMRLAREMKLPIAESSALFYALLLKDLGCSSNSAKVSCLFGADDLATKCDLKTANWTSTIASLGYVARNVAPRGSLLQKATRFVAVATGGQKVARQLVQLRCDRGATIARNLQLPDLTAEAIRSLDEHWDGGGHPGRLAGDQIPMLARIMGLAQTVEVFWSKFGSGAACDMAAERSGTWFDPNLVAMLCFLRNDEKLWRSMNQPNAAAEAAKLEPIELTIVADDAALDRIAEGFSQVIDAKSPWTFCHSDGVAEVSVGIARVLGIEGRRLRILRRAALLHDIGKLGVSNLILDKPGKLTPAEVKQMRRHPEFTLQILQRVHSFQEFAHTAAAHHERLDGRGYFRGLTGAALNLEVRILGVADMYEALAARRPYRQDLTKAEALSVIRKESATGLCPSVVAALETFLATTNFEPFQVAA